MESPYASAIAILVQASLLPRAAGGIEVSCERVRVNRVVGWGDVVKPPTCVKRRCAKRANAEGGGEWRDGNHSMHMPPYHILMWLAYIHVLCTVQTLPRSAASPICLALLESCRSAVLRSHHHPLAPPMCVYVRTGVVPLRGGRRLFGAEPSVKNPLLHVSLYGKTQ